MTTRTLIHALVALLAVPIASWAQTETTLAPEAGARLSLGADYKVAKGLHISLEEELRLDNNFAALNRLQTTVGVSYKILRNLRLGAGYAMINPYKASASGFSGTRHRLMFDAVASVRYGAWQFALKERLQFTHRTGSYNAYQSPATASALKSRISVKYKGMQLLEPYAYAEVRHSFSNPVINATYADSTWIDGSGRAKGDAGWFLDGFNGTGVNRYRLALGTDIHLDAHNNLNAAILLDRIIDPVVDANAEGTRLKSYEVQKGYIGWITIGYEYQF